MAKVYSAPKEIEPPSFNFKDMTEYEESISKYEAAIKAHIESLGYHNPETGKVIRFGVADGYASYMVISLKPVSLIHLEIGDAYQFQYAHLLTAAEIRKCMKREESLRSIFSK